VVYLPRDRGYPPPNVIKRGGAAQKKHAGRLCGVCAIDTLFPKMWEALIIPPSFLGEDLKVGQNGRPPRHCAKNVESPPPKRGFLKKRGHQKIVGEFPHTIRLKSKRDWLKTPL